MSTIDDIISRMKQPTPGVTEKTAGAQAPALPSTADAVTSALTALTSKTAEAQTPDGATAAGALEKIAADVLASEHELTKKHAAEYGAAFCDGFVARLAAYDGPLATKTASVQGALTAEQITKIASDAVLQAHSLFEKQAAADFERGHSDFLKEAHALATEIHLEGQASARAVIAALGQQG